MPISINDITIRTDLRPGDIGNITYLHGKLYSEEHTWGIGFESYVAAGLAEFYENYHPDRSCIWIAEHDGKIVGSLVLLDRKDSAQLRYFLVLPEYRGIGLGKRLMELFIAFLRDHGYRSAYLWTTGNLENAAALYARFGFQLTEKKSSTAFGRTVEEQRYDLTL